MRRVQGDGGQVRMRASQKIERAVRSVNRSNA